MRRIVFSSNWSGYTAIPTVNTSSLCKMDQISKCRCVKIQNSWIIHSGKSSLSLISQWILRYDKKKHEKQKKKLAKLGFIKIKDICASKGVIKKTKSKPTSWESGTDTYALRCVKPPARGRLLRGTGRSAPGSVTAEKGGRMWKGAPAGGGVRTCSWFTAVHRN